MIEPDSPLGLLDRILIEAWKSRGARYPQVAGLPVADYAAATAQMNRLFLSGKIRYRQVADADEYDRPNFLFRGVRIVAVPGTHVTLTWFAK